MADHEAISPVDEAVRWSCNYTGQNGNFERIMVRFNQVRHEAWLVLGVTVIHNTKIVGPSGIPSPREINCMQASMAGPWVQVWNRHGGEAHVEYNYNWEYEIYIPGAGIHELVTGQEQDRQLVEKGGYLSSPFGWRARAELLARLERSGRTDTFQEAWSDYQRDLREGRMKP